MLSFAKEILEKRIVQDENNNEYPLNSETNVSQCEFLQKIIDDIEATICVEIGLAYGISSLFICESISQKKNPKLISIDPFQHEWKDIGLLNIKKCGFAHFVEFHQDFSHNILPKLLFNNVKVDFAYIDTTKVFDVVLLDAYYLTRLLRIGGVMVFDDCKWTGINRMVRYISKWPHLKIYRKYGESSSNRKKYFFSRIARNLPQAKLMFADRLLQLDDDLGINAQCIAFQKIGEDERNWDWNVNF